MFQKLFLAALIVALAAGLALAAGPVDQPTSGYGADGSYSVSSFSYTNPKSPFKYCAIYYPVNGTPAPTVFYSHGWAATDPGIVQNLMTHVASRGYSFVFCQYPSIFVTDAARYDYLRQGFEKAIDNYSAYCDSDQVAFVGQSYGAGATPRMAIDGLANGWGSEGAAMFVNAPYYSFELTNSDLSNFDSDVKAIFMVYDEDDMNDQRMAIDLFDNINIAAAEKDYYIHYSDTNCSYTLEADHYTWKTDTSADGELDGMDYWGIWRHLDALLDYAFTGSTAAKEVALGNGAATQVEMGVYNCDSTDVPECEVASSPSATQAESYYYSPWSSTDNPRY